MHKFKRDNSPVDLKSIEKECRNSGWEPWSYFSKNYSQQHSQIRDSLYEAQKHCCAYCDCQLNPPSIPGNAHIEHLERRSDNPRRIFDWSNMFLSCDHNDSCGYFKDNSKPKIDFDIKDIIDPSVEDPQDFFQYDVQGRVFPRQDVPQNLQGRAKETIRVFNLNSPRLCSIRRQIAVTIAPYQNAQV